MQAVVSRVKVLAGMDIAEKRLPQDGSIKLELDGRNIDLRISSLPTILGEKIVIRILDREKFALNLDELNFTPENLALYRRLYNYGSGIVLLTGPTGSGKTTTLYATLAELNSSERNIVTIEDPVEYRINGISQVAVNEKAGLTFASGLLQAGCAAFCGRTRILLCLVKYAALIRRQLPYVRRLPGIWCSVRCIPIMPQEQR